MIENMDPHLFYAVLLISAFVMSLMKYAEVAFMGVKHGNLREILAENERFKKVFLKWIKNGNLMLASLQFMRYLIEIGFIILLFRHSYNLVLTLGISFGIFIVFGEYVPRTIALQKGISRAAWLFSWLYYAAMIFTPLVRLLMLPADIIIKLLGGEMVLSAPYMTDLEEQIIRNLLEDENMQESQMISSILEFKDTTAREIMVPRVDIVAVPSDITYEDLLALIDEEGHSRLPVYSERLDNVLGFVYAKDLLGIDEKAFDLEELLREVFYIPETKKINSLLKDFQAKHTHMSFVVDEYGDLVGLVTIEDVLEEIVGEIEDEYDEEEPLYRKVSEKEYVISPKMTTEEFKDEFSIDLEQLINPDTEDFDTVAGFIISTTGNLPERDFTCEYEKFIFKILDADNRRILKIGLELKGK